MEIVRNLKQLRHIIQLQVQPLLFLQRLGIQVEHLILIYQTYQ